MVGVCNRWRHGVWLEQRGVGPPGSDELITELRRLGATAASGSFGAHMAVELTNHGPVTLLLEV